MITIFFQVKKMNNTLDNWIKQGLPCIKVGKTVRFSKTEINRWLQKQ